jgi:hypothetical protein
MTEHAPAALTEKETRDRLEALRMASEQEALHIDRGRLPLEAECQHAGRWGRYCGRSNRETRRARL